MREASPTRKGNTPIKVWCLPAERAAIVAIAQASGLSLSKYLRSVGMGYEVRGILDYERIDDLAKINADLGRLGGLLKLWLTDDAKVAGYGTEPMRHVIAGVLAEVRANQATMREIIATVVVPSSAKTLAAKTPRAPS